MANLAADTFHTTRKDEGRDAWPIKDGTTLYRGALVSVTAGYLTDWSDAGSDEMFAGVLIGGKDRAIDGVLTGETSDDLPPWGEVDTSGVILMNLDSVGDSPSQAKVGDLVYCTTSNTDDMTLEASGKNDPIGILWAYRSATDVDVKLFTPAEHLAQQTA